MVFLITNGFHNVCSIIGEFIIKVQNSSPTNKINIHLAQAVIFFMSSATLPDTLPHIISYQFFYDQVKNRIEW